MTDTNPQNLLIEHDELLAKLSDVLWNNGLNSAARDVDAAVERLHNFLAQPEPEEPTEEELLALMPQSMRDEFSYAAKVSSDATGGQVRPGIFRVCLNHSALEYARAVHARTVLARRGRPTPQPISVSERLPGPEDCDEEGKCWWGAPIVGLVSHDTRRG